MKILDKIYDKIADRVLEKIKQEKPAKIKAATTQSNKQSLGIIGKNLRLLRVRDGLTQHDIDKVLERVNSCTYLETGKRALTSKEMLRLANFFKVSPSYFLEKHE